MLTLICLLTSFILLFFSFYLTKPSQPTIKYTKELEEYYLTEPELTTQQKLKSLLNIFKLVLVEEHKNYLKIRRLHDLYSNNYLPQYIWDNIMNKKNRLSYELMLIEGEVESIRENSFTAIRDAGYSYLSKYKNEVERKLNLKKNNNFNSNDEVLKFNKNRGNKFFELERNWGIKYY